MVSTTQVSDNISSAVTVLSTGFSTNFTEDNNTEDYDHTLFYSIVSVCVIVLAVVVGLVCYRIISARRVNNLRQRLVSLRRFDPNLRGRKSTKAPSVQTPDGFPTDDPLMIYSTNET